MKKILVLLLIFVASCAKNGKEFYLKDFVVESNLQQNEMQKTEIIGKTQVVSRFFHDKDGNFVREYSFLRRKNNFASYLPIVSLFMPRVYENYEALVIFDKKQKKMFIYDFANEISMKSTVFCDFSAVSCVRNISY